LDRTADNNQIQSYLQTLLYTPESLKRTLLKLALWARDTSGAFDRVARDADASPGEYYRTTKARSSNMVRMQGRLSIDCFNVLRPLVENVSILLQFTPNVAKDCTVCTIAAVGEPIIEIHECYLKVRDILYYFSKII
jgi:uncharacterized protein YyaL (SSP411 family)